MNLRHKFGDMIWLSETKKKNVPANDEIELIDYQLKEAQMNLAETCTFIGNFSGTDGAIILQTSLIVEGFSSEILLDKVSPVPVIE